jgi:hypothetical protein
MPPPSSLQPDRPLILTMLAKGMTEPEIAVVFPDLTLDEIRSAVLQATELMKDPEALLAPSSASIQSIIDKARRAAPDGLLESEVEDLAVAEVRAYRREKAEALRRR